MPVSLPPCRWVFPPVDRADEDGFLATGADLEPGTLLAAYAAGVFPMPLSRRGLGWWSPDPRAVIPLDGLRVSRSLRAACRRFEIRVDTVFGEVVKGCADPRRQGGWISRDMRTAYQRLHEAGWAHSVEAWTPAGQLAGGLYGVSIGGLFAGESMFYRERDASKVALVALVRLLREGEAAGRLLDVQWRTAHLRSLGAVDLPRQEYLRRLGVALLAEPPAAFGTGAPDGAVAAPSATARALPLSRSVRRYGRRRTR